MTEAVGEAPEWAGLGLGPEPMEGVWLGTFRRLSWILRRAGKKGEFRNGSSLSEGVVRVLAEWGVLDIFRRDSEMGQ